MRSVASEALGNWFSHSPCSGGLRVDRPPAAGDPLEEQRRVRVLQPVFRMGDEQKEHVRPTTRSNAGTLGENALPFCVVVPRRDNQLVLCRAEDQLAHVYDDRARVLFGEFGFHLPVAVGDELEGLGGLLQRGCGGDTADGDVEQQFVDSEVLPVALVASPEDTVPILPRVVGLEFLGQRVDPLSGTFVMDGGGIFNGDGPCSVDNIFEIFSVDRHSCVSSKPIWPNGPE